MAQLHRRSLLRGTAAAGATLIVRPAAAAAVSGTLHKNLTAMWEAVRQASNGRLDVSVHAENDKMQGGDLAALKMLIDREIQFFTLMGGIIGTVGPGRRGATGSLRVYNGERCA
jgi:TRAP-type transport system periplasmic protein